MLYKKNIPPWHLILSAWPASLDATQRNKQISIREITTTTDLKDMQISSATSTSCGRKYTLTMRIWAATWQNQQSECMPSEDSDQPGHQPSLIRVFAVRMKKLWSLATHWTNSEDLIRLGGSPGWFESSLGAQSVTLLVLSCRGSYGLLASFSGLNVLR